MGILDISEARREGARTVIGISGISGSGKTFTALQLAYGMARGDGRKVGFLDTENRRGRLYADPSTYELVQKSLGLRSAVRPFLHADLYAPFSPARYSQAILEFQQAGVEVLVIDSVSHEWEGPGGCDEIARAGNPRTPRWNDAKREHKRFVNTLLTCDMHIIACIRAREKVRIVQQNGETKFESLGILPVCEKNFMFEMTASLMMWNEGREQQTMKCPEQLRPILGRGKGYITAADGLALREWVDGGQQLDQEVERYRNTLRTVTEQGMAALQAAWEETPKHVKKALGAAFLDDLKASASAFDEQRALESERAGNTSELNRELLANAE